MRSRRLPLLFLLLGLARPAAGADRPDPAPALQALGQRLADRLAARRTPAYAALLAATEGPQGRLNAEPDLRLVGVDARGRPLFYGLHNLNAARTVGVDQLWPGGPSGLGLAGANVAGELGLWDGGGVLLAHQEFGGRVAQMDSPAATHYHATHVAGTMVAAGVNAAARGMSPSASLRAWEWANDEVEMASAAAAGLLVSNHSYGFVAGWNRDSGGTWYWYGDVTLSATEDAGFGLYTEDAAAWDEIMSAAPHYLIVMSAGNDRDDTGPAAGATHWYWNPATDGWAASTATRAPDGGASGFDTLPYRAVAKNPLVVGAVGDLPGGWTAAGDVAMAPFSNWGPTDDGRVKPDLVANGVSVFSAVNTGTGNYSSYSGTSMASPGVAGALHLVAQQWKAAHGGEPARAATLKALAIHTACEAGPAPGPDYMFGHGLLDARAAAQLAAAAAGRVFEGVLVPGRADTLLLQAAGGALVATLAWIDPPGPAAPWALDPPDRALVHDLDLRLEPVAGGQPLLPWRLDPVAPAAPATRGDNDRDNVERVAYDSAGAGLYRAIVSAKGALDAGQPWSLALSGLAAAPAQPPVVSNVAFAQRRDGSGIVDVTFDLADPDSPALTVTLAASRDDGATWDLVVASVAGHVGPGVPPGAARAIAWNFAADNPGLDGAGFRVRVTASDAP